MSGEYSSVHGMNREERLHRRELYRIRRAEETPQDREVRLARRRERDRARCTTLSAERRQAIIDQRRKRFQHTHSNRPETVTTDNPIQIRSCSVDDHDVIQMMKQFHEEIGSLKAAKCIICQECFPTLKIKEIVHCACCHRDNLVPKLYFKENNMHLDLYHLSFQ